MLGKLRTIQLVKADLQLIKSFFVNIRNKGNRESDEIVSKSNYGPRPGYSIEYAILEKRLVFDNRIVTESHNICAIADLKACYDKQLSKIGSIFQESVGVETKPIKLVTNTLPIIQHYVRTAFGVSKDFCG